MMAGMVHRTLLRALLIGSALVLTAMSASASRGNEAYANFDFEPNAVQLRGTDRSYLQLRQGACHYRHHARLAAIATVFPMAGEQGGEHLVQKRGTVLTQAYGLWFPALSDLHVDMAPTPPLHSDGKSYTKDMGLTLLWALEPLPAGQTSASCVPSLASTAAAAPMASALEQLSNWVDASPQRALSTWVPLLIAETGRVELLLAWRERIGTAFSAHAYAQMAELAAHHGHSGFLKWLLAQGVVPDAKLWLKLAACRTEAPISTSDHQRQVAAVSQALAEVGARPRVEDILPALSCARLQDDLGAFKHLLDQLPSDQGDARLLPSTYEYSSFGMLAATLSRFPSLLNEGEEQRLRMGEALAATRLMSVEELDWLQQRGVRFDRGAKPSSSLLTVAWRHSPPTVLTQLRTSRARLANWTEFQVERAVHDAWTPLNGHGLAWLLSQGLRPEAPSRLAMALLDRGDDAAPALAEMKALGMLQWDASQRQVALRRCVLSLSAACARLWWDDATPEEMAEAIALAQTQRTDDRQQAYYGVPVRRVRTLPNQAELKQTLLEALRSRALQLKTP